MKKSDSKSDWKMRPELPERAKKKQRTEEEKRSIKTTGRWSVYALSVCVCVRACGTDNGQWSAVCVVRVRRLLDVHRKCHLLIVFGEKQFSFHLVSACTKHNLQFHCRRRMHTDGWSMGERVAIAIYSENWQNKYFRAVIACTLHTAQRAPFVKVIAKYKKEFFGFRSCEVLSTARFLLFSFVPSCVERWGKDLMTATTSESVSVMHSFQYQKQIVRIEKSKQNNDELQSLSFSSHRYARGSVAVSQRKTIRTVLGMENVPRRAGSN